MSRRRDRVVEQKSDGTVVTNIDRAIERFLRERIESKFPDHAILGEEEGGAAVLTDAPLWAIDPVDGTTNLANGLPHWGVSVGLVENGVPVVGVVAFPLLGETFAGGLGLGATRNNEPLADLGLGGPTEWEQTYAICSSSVRTGDFRRVPARLRIFGSAALELCWTAAGFVRGCQSIGTSLYDVAAGLCIAHEVGARAAWLSDGAEWKPASMLDADDAPARKRDVLITAPPETLTFLRERL